MLNPDKKLYINFLKKANIKLYLLKSNPNNIKYSYIGGEGGYFVVEITSLLGRISQGKTREEALANIE